MICVRCGNCCRNYMVMIVDDPQLGITEGNVIVHIGNDTPCKHLEGDKPGEYSCKVHSEPWYEKSPCFSHGQIESSPDCVCRIGEYILNNQKEQVKEI